MDSVLKDTTSTTIFEDRYQLLIDTTLKIDARLYGTYVNEYDPLDYDFFLKKVPDLKDVKLKRDPTDGQKRYLHTINKTKKDQILALRKIFNFVIDLNDKDDRTVLLDKPNLKIIEYTDKSLAFFSTDVATLSQLRSLDGKGLKYYSSLTGPGMTKSSGYLLFKSSKEYSKILQMFSEETTHITKTNNNMENVAPGPNGRIRFRIRGDDTYIDSKMNELREDFGDNLKIIQENTLPDNIRNVEIEILDT